jgi:predicted transcriptional regulator
MTVKQFAENFGFSTVCIPDPEREVRGSYIGDLLSWVMGKASADNAWITIMSNINTIAVASLADLSCIILAEGVTLDEEVRSAAEAKRINVLSSAKSAFEIAVLISGAV